jgi:hypothetical protein
MNTETCNPNAGYFAPNEVLNRPAEGGIVRSYFLKTIDFVSGEILSGFPAIGMGKIKKAYQIPIKKGRSTAWYKNLYKRGEAEIYTGKELAYIGMPIGGLFARMVSPGGKGKL